MGDILNKFKTRTVTVGITPQEIGVGLPYRTQVTILPPASGIVYWGEDGTVTVSSGIPLAAGGQPVTFNVTNSAVKVYLVSAANTDVKVVEAQ